VAKENILTTVQKQSHSIGVTRTHPIEWFPDWMRLTRSGKVPYFITQVFHQWDLKSKIRDF